jgi:hypothetical protein
MDDTQAPPQSPDTALATLKAHLGDPNYPTLSLARELQAYLDVQDVGQRTLAERLQMSSKRSYFAEVIGLLKLPASEQAKIEGKTLSLREIRAFAPVDQSVDRVNQSVNQSVDHVDQSVDPVDQSVDPVDQGVDHPVDQPINPLDHVKSSKTTAKSFRHGERTPGGGGSQDKTLGELIVSVMVGLLFLPAYGMCWLVQQRAYNDLCELEERTYRNLVANDPWNVIRWVVVAIVLIISAPFLIKKYQAWRHPAASSAPSLPQSPAQPVSPSVPVSPRLPSAPSVPLSPHPSVPPSSSAPTLLPPSEVHVNVMTPDKIILSWRAVSPDARYNVYSSASRDLTGLRKENDHALTYNSVTWTPETGLDTYWVVVTTLGKDGQESRYSEAIQVVRHPGKGDHSDLINDAAGVVKKVLPW